MIPIDHTSGYSLLSSILLNSIVRKSNVIGAENFQDLITDGVMAAGFVSGKSNSGLTLLIMCLVGELCLGLFQSGRV